MDAIRRASAVLFYLFGAVIIVTVLLMRRGMMPAPLIPFAHTLDLPLLFVGMVYGGSSLYASLTKGRGSLMLLIAVFLPLIVLFGVFCWLNFAFSFPNF
jgi:hypothetical protein